MHPPSVRIFCLTVLTVLSLHSSVADAAVSQANGLHSRTKREVDYIAKLKECPGSGRLFEDSDFPTPDEFNINGKIVTSVQWKRPQEIVQKPEFVSGKISRFNVVHGLLDDAGFLAAVESLTLHSELFKTVVIPDQHFQTDYCGQFYFRFWQYGEWVYVVVDDRLPTVSGQLIFTHSPNNKDFWVALLEKAYAKLLKSYMALTDVRAADVMTDLIGWVTQTFDTEEHKENLYALLSKNVRVSMVIGYTHKDVATSETGLYTGVPYVITNTKKVPVFSNTVKIVRLLNPYGNDKDEWTGQWSDRSDVWDKVTEETKRMINLSFAKDGEFWISTSDFTRYFGQLDICSGTPISLESPLNGSLQVSVKNHLYQGMWRKLTDPSDLISETPQFRFTLNGVSTQKMRTIVCLMQKDKRTRTDYAGNFMSIGYFIFPVEHPETDPDPLDKDYTSKNKYVGRTLFVKRREICQKFELKPGVYAIIPLSNPTTNEGGFVVRVFYETYSVKPKSQQNASIPESIPEMDDLFHELFRKLAGVDREIDVWELQQSLNTATKKVMRDKDVSLEACRSLISAYDKDSTGKLNCEEFKQVLSVVKVALKVFSEHDKDATGEMNSYELRTALSTQGYNLVQTTIDGVMARFSNKKGTCSFDDFLELLTRLKVASDIFLGNAINGQMRITLSKWLEYTLLI